MATTGMTQPYLFSGNAARERAHESWKSDRQQCDQLKRWLESLSCGAVLPDEALRSLKLYFHADLIQEAMLAGIMKRLADIESRLPPKQIAALAYGDTMGNVVWHAKSDA